jgi:hypothetical protein
MIRKRVAYLAAMLRLASNRLWGMRSLMQSITLPYERYLGALLYGFSKGDQGAAVVLSSIVLEHG